MTFPEGENLEQDNKDKVLVRLAKIDAGYTVGRPRVLYDMDIISGDLSKPLPYLSGYTPAAGDRVLVMNGVIVGKIV